MSLFNRLARIRENANPVPQSQPAAPLLAGFAGGREEHTPFGTYYLIEGNYDGAVVYPWAEQPDVCANLQMLYGIGPVTEERLKGSGYGDLQHLKDHGRWGDQAKQALKVIAAEDVRAMRRLGARDAEILCYFPPERMVFLDIETTGLWFSQPLFLVGLLYWRNGRLEVRQYLARRLGEEKPLLAALVQELAQSALVVTFNGKQFDIPYIEGRTVEHRLFYKCGLEQIDLLYHARRHYRGKLPDCRLVTLEEHLLGMRREDDLPGALIPETYFRFVQSQDPGLMEGILQHNVLDLLAMARLFYLVGDRVEDQRRPG